MRWVHVPIRPPMRTFVELRNRWKGKRAALLLTGPSLASDEAREAVKTCDVVFGVHSAWKLFDVDVWTCATWPNFQEAVGKHHPKVIVAHNSLWGRWKSIPGDIECYTMNAADPDRFRDSPTRWEDVFSDDFLSQNLTMRWYTAGAGVYAMSLAVIGGVSEIIRIGHDGPSSGVMNHDNSKPLDAQKVRDLGIIEDGMNRFYADWGDRIRLRSVSSTGIGKWPRWKK